MGRKTQQAVPDAAAHGVSRVACPVQGIQQSPQGLWLIEGFATAQGDAVAPVCANAPAPVHQFVQRHALAWIGGPGVLRHAAGAVDAAALKPDADALARIKRAVRDAGYEPRALDEPEDDHAASWHGIPRDFLPVLAGLVLSAPLALPMLGVGLVVGLVVSV